ncbi:hypothetical protein [Crossiella cryophila]|uniref:Uncharacterized protein n=1 Tax=Crossiella cryophila TaxID=43355 RepID=A0A7W7FTZ4_9PSEU|nr:hypothetical protein [Crossiella cryophila]MBB4678696.1 hypothetical protein [Crossiella cryophila]
MTDDGRRDLARMRASARVWPELRCEPGPDAGFPEDVNFERRAEVLRALQHDRRPGDLELVRWLLAQEVAQCRRSWGLAEETQLAGYLLAEYRQVEDVWLQWDLKSANFDTQCGYDGLYLVAAGVTATIEFVRASEHADRDAVLAYLHNADGVPEWSEPELAAWFAARREWFPATPG